jgi:hypothetical protein
LRRETAWRSLILALVVFGLPGFNLARPWVRLSLFTLTLVAFFFLFDVRLRLARSTSLSSYLAEWEVAAHLAFLLGTGILIAQSGLGITRPVFVLPTTPGRIAAINLCVAACSFMMRPATQIVRGILDKADTLPLTPRDPKVVDVREYNRGRTIGNIERVIMLAMVGLGSYEALGLLMAAKGLIRANELGNRDFAEYFIVGNLASAAVALLVGAALAHAVPYLWSK